MSEWWMLAIGVLSVTTGGALVFLGNERDYYRKKCIDADHAATNAQRDFEYERAELRRLRKHCVDAKVAHWEVNANEVALFIWDYPSKEKVATRGFELK